MSEHVVKQPGRVVKAHPLKRWEPSAEERAEFIRLAEQNAEAEREAFRRMRDVFIDT